jgi:hypothetical protein
MNANAEINANNAVEVEPTPLEKISGLIFDIADKIPNGVYLELMNNTKKLFDEKEKVKHRSFDFNIMTIEDKAMMIKNEDKLCILGRVKREEVDELNIGIRFYEKDDLLFPVRAGFVGIFIRLFTAGRGYKFMKITKINMKSIKYDILFITAGNNTKIKKNNTLKFKDGKYYEDLSSYKTKQILFYSTSNMVCNYLINQHFLNWEDAETDNNLSIWN